MEPIDLLSYLPPILWHFLEIREICLAETPEFETAREAYITVCKNLYISFCDERGIERFERELGIFPEEFDSLDIRRNRIKALSMNSSIYTMRWLKNWIGKIGIIEAPVLQNYVLKVMLPAKCDYKSLFDALVSYIPANVKLAQSIKLGSKEQTLFTGVATRTAIKRTFEGASAVLQFLLADENGTLISDEKGRIFKIEV